MHEQQQQKIPRKQSTQIDMIDNHLFSRNGGRTDVSFQNFTNTDIEIDNDHNEEETTFGTENGLDQQHHLLPPLKQCPSCTNLEDLCAGNSFKDHLYDERRVFRSSDGNQYFKFFIVK